MALTTDVTLIDNPSALAALKEYDTSELASLVGYIDQTITWMQSYSMQLETSQDVVAIRVGMPYIGSDTTIDSETIYTDDGNDANLIKTISLDALKFTARDTTKKEKYQQQSFNYKSPVIHRIFGRYFVDGVNNKTGHSYLDNINVSLSSLASIPVQYEGVVQLPPQTVSDVPDYVIKCVVYLIQNPGLLNDTSAMLDDEYIPKGDLEYYTTKQFFDAIVFAKDRAQNKLPVVSELDLPLGKEEAIRLIFEETGIGDGFKNLKYGGTLEGIRTLIRIPASRNNQDQLEGLLGADDVMSEVFKEVWVNIDGKDATEGAKAEELADLYSTDPLDYPLYNEYGGYYGCKDGGSYRHFMVSDAWLQTATPEKIAIVFWMGLDLDMYNNIPNCTLDKILITIAVIVITYLSWGTAGSVAGAAGQALLVASAVVTIATTWGVLDQKTGARLGLALAVISLGTTLWNTVPNQIGLNAVGMKLVLEVASTGLAIVDNMTESKFNADMEELENEQAEVDASPEFYASEMRFILGGYATHHYALGCEMDYEKGINDLYEPFTVYKEKGFRSS